MRVRIASAGTGKTTSLVLRYLELIGSGTPLRRIAGVTYTRAAAAELRQRVRSAIRELLERGDYLGLVRLDEERRPNFEEALRELDGASLSTIHGFMTEVLRLAAPALGLDPDFGTVGEWEAQELFEEELRSLLYLASSPEHPLHQRLRHLDERSRAQLLQLFGKRSLVEAFAADDDDRSRALVAVFEASYEAFERRLGARVLSPAEIERRALRLTRMSTAMHRVAARYRAVLVDEFQDVNPLQGRFFEALEEYGLEIEVVGDPKQSIYGFRNADVEVFRRALANGEELAPLASSYRHGELVNRFLNSLTRTMAASNLGFGPREAPSIEVAAATSADRGRIEVHWVVGDETLADLRQREAEVLAGRMAALHREHDIQFSEMAVIARSHDSLSIAETALNRAGVPTVLLRGRGYFERPEIRDLYHALRAGIEPAGLSFAAWLRGPFGNLPPEDMSAVLAAPEPETELARRNAEAAMRYARLRELVLEPPLNALKALIREPFPGGRSFFSLLDPGQRENVDALLFTVARQPPADLEVLLERLESLVRQTDAGEVPQSGDGVRLVTVHSAKGLEWRAAAVFDAGRGLAPNRDLIRVDPETGLVSLPGTPSHESLGERLALRESSELYRLLYVAASRPREVLLLSGSVSRNQYRGWSEVLASIGVGPDAKERSQADFLLAVHGRISESGVVVNREQVEAPTQHVPAWIDRVFAPNRFPPISSPSRLRETLPESSGGPSGESEHEPVPVGGAGGDEIPGRASTVGTLVHYAISQSWRPDDSGQMANLRAQEVMFPFDGDEQNEILLEVAELLRGYWSMLGRELPGLAERERDEPELPMALAEGATVWQGIIDRLYLVDGVWYLDDYKTDRQVRPESYLGQLAIYSEAVRRVLGVTPLSRLVYLRNQELIELQPSDLSAAFAQVESSTRGGHPVEGG